MKQKDTFNLQISKAESIISSLNFINIIFFILGIIEAMATIYLLSVIENGMGPLVIIVGIILLIFTYISYLVLSAFIALLEQTAIHNKLLLRIEDNQKSDERFFKDMDKSSYDFVGTTLSEINPTIEEEVVRFKPLASEYSNIKIESKNIQYYELLNAVEGDVNNAIQVRGFVLQFLNSSKVKVGTSTNGESEYIILVLQELEGIKMNSWIEVEGELLSLTTIVDESKKSFELPLVEVFNMKL